MGIPNVTAMAVDLPLLKKQLHLLTLANTKTFYGTKEFNCLEGLENHLSVLTHELQKKGKTNVVVIVKGSRERVR